MFEMRSTKDLEDSVKKQVNKLMNFRAFSIGISASLLALACGGSNDNPSNPPDVTTTPPDVTTTPVVRETCDDNPRLAECQPAVVTPPTQVTPGGNNPPSSGGSAQALAKAAAENILQSNCGGCHGSQLTPATARAGMNYIDNIDQLVANQKIIPLNAAGSRVIERMRNGQMPPADSGLPKVSDQEINIVADYIDNAQFWPGVAPASDVCPDQVFSFDDLYAKVSQDLLLQDNNDALTTRYISLTNRFTAGVCANTTLDAERNAMFKLVNMLSDQASIRQPEPVNSEATLYRIDLGDYGWDEPVTVLNADGSTTDFTDKWEAIIANNQYAIPFQGDDADSAVAESGTTVPVMFSDSLLDAASIGNLYYALIGVDAQDTLDNFILNTLGIDVVQNLADSEQIRAGTTKSRISRQDRVIERDEINNRQGVLWQAFDFLANDANQSIFDDPFGFAEGGTEAMFSLNNGLLGFIIADADSVIKEDSDILLDTNQNNFRAVTSISCSNCHAQGFIPVKDEVAPIALANAIQSGLNKDEVQQLEDVYPSAAVFATTVENDSNDFKARLSQAKVPTEGGDPVSQTFFRFDARIHLNDAAGDLGVTKAVLDHNITILDPALGVLSGDVGQMDRDDFTAVYGLTLCQLTQVNDNQPTDAFCADAGFVAQ